MSSRSFFDNRLPRLVLEQGGLFVIALGFLSRLGPARQADNAQMSASVFYHPPAGLCIGLVAALPAMTGLCREHAFVAAWLYVFLTAWLTRAIHLDGLADVLDAVGSGKHGESFRDVLKDSCVGAFGATGIGVALCGQLVLAAPIIAAGHMAPLLFAPLYGRCLPIVVVCLAPPYARTGLGALLNAAPRAACLVFAACLALGGGLISLGPGGLASTILLSLPILFFLVRLARREGGYNGDFLGFAIIGGELAALLSGVFFL